MTHIYHITHLSNLAGIIARGGLCCDSVADSENLCQVSIAHAHIKARRKRRRVPVGPQGVVADYVPFYFSPRSPMLYTISRGNVAGYQDGQAKVVYLVTSVERIVQGGLAFVFSDGHAEMELSTFFEDVAHLTEIDWEVMRATAWHDTNQDPDRKRRRQAEFLVHQFVPWRLVRGVAVIGEETRARAEEMIATLDHRPKVRVMRQWYY